ncbi:MAG: substrate-binding domain-containing protein [Eubacteriales bacterium]
MIKKPMYSVIMDDIEKDIKIGVYQPGSQIPTQREICEKYNVSRIVASTALSNLASEGLIVCEKGKGSFVVDRKKSANISVGVKGTIFFVVPNVMSNHCMMLANSVAQEVEKAGYVCLMYLTDGDISREEKITDMILSSYTSGGNVKCDGLILFSSGRDVYNMNAMDLLRYGVPTVLVDRNLPGLPFPCVKTDNRKAIRMATSLLVEQGHNKIVVCCCSHGAVTSLSERIDGFIQEMADRNIQIEPSLIVNDLYTEQQQKKLEEIFKSRRATAYIALNTATNACVTDILERCSLKCPDDISAVVFDKSGAFNCRTAQEPTHILQNTELIAREAVRHLVAIIEGKEEEKACNYLIDPMLVQGYSTRKL